MPNIHKSKDPVKEAWIADQIEYQNPNLPQNRQKRTKFPEPTDEQLAFQLRGGSFNNKPQDPMKVEDINDLPKPRLEEGRNYEYNLVNGLYSAIVTQKLEGAPGEEYIILASIKTQYKLIAKNFIEFCNSNL